MYTLDLAEPECFDAYGVLDIETTGFDGAEDDLVAIGVGYYDGSGPADVEVITRSSVRNDELALMCEAFAWLDRREPEGLVTYNGAEFDVPFLEARSRRWTPSPERPSRASTSTCSPSASAWLPRPTRSGPVSRPTTSRSRRRHGG